MIIDEKKVKLFIFFVNKLLVEKIVKSVGILLLNVEVIWFVDGEIIVNIEEFVRGNYVFVI